jgi:hypothetical protein
MVLGEPSEFVLVHGTTSIRRPEVSRQPEFTTSIL